MYLSVQKIISKKKFQGNAKDIIQTEMNYGFDGKSYVHYDWRSIEERFERENIIFRFVIKKSFRQNGKVKQLQLFIGKLDWYTIDFAGDCFCEFTDDKNINRIKSMFNPTEDELNDIQDKIEIEIENCVQELEKIYKKSEEYKVVKAYHKRIDKWNQAKKTFIAEYGSYSEKDFNAIYNFDLKLMNKDLLEYYKLAKRYSEESQKSSYKDYKSDNYNYTEPIFSSSTYSDPEKAYLKKFYKTLAKNYHPDIVTDDGKSMQFLNKLKEQWQV